jgi:SET and MYND domain-containing protein
VSAAASPGSAVYLLASLFNHSCDPNVNVAWPAGTATVKFTAARDIDPGEQLTISYINQAMPVAARQQVLEFSYGFQCHCALCVEEMEPSTPPPPPT